MPKKLLIVTLILAAAYVVLLPVPAPTFEGARPELTGVRGTIHVHTNRSDGRGTIATVAAAAARAGLAFVILTDHGDATRPPDPPTYVDGVLIIDAVEISTTGGHIVALNLPQAEYPLGGDPRDALDDIHRLGGTAIAAHPDSLKDELRWTDWDAPIDGLEWLNADSEWRDEGAATLARALLIYPVRHREAVSLLLDRPETLARWDGLLKTRRVIGMVAPDAHARLGISGLGEPYDRHASLPLPSYETMFRAFSVGLQGVSLERNADRDAAAVLSAIRDGRFHSTVDGLGTPGELRFEAESGPNKAAAGAVLPLAGPVTLRVTANVPANAVVAIMKDGVESRRGNSSPLVESTDAEPAVYRVEVRLPTAPGNPPVPWMVSNPIYVGRTQAIPPASAPNPGTPGVVVYGDEVTIPAAIERGGEGQGAFNVIPAVPGRQLLFRYAIGGRLSDNPYAALSLPVRGVTGSTAIRFTARADHPMRLSVQLRAPGGEGGRRWRRGVYVDTTPREFSVPLNELRSTDPLQPTPPSLDSVDSLLFVVDGVHTPLGKNGQVWLDDVRFVR